MEKIKDLFSNLKGFKGEILFDEESLKKHSRDASIFEMMPSAVTVPEDAEDIKRLVAFVAENKKNHPELSLTAWAGGTDMSGGPLTDSVIIDMKNLNSIKSLPETENEAAAESGMYYRDFEKETMKKGLLLPSYPASREICTVGGIVMNNSAGEKTLRYGKTNKHIVSLKVILSDGKEYEIKPLSEKELENKKSQNNFEGEVYRKIHKLVSENKEVIEKARPNVLKNSAGYALWDIEKNGKFDLTQLFCGSQGTLGILTEARIRLIKPKEHRRLAIIFFKNLKPLPDAVNALLPLDLESMESFDDNTLKLALKFFPAIAKRIKGQNIFTLLMQFLPEAFIGLRMMGLPKLIVLAQIAENSEEEAEEKAKKIKEALRPFPMASRIIKTAKEAEKYWVIRRESFNLLRQKVKNKRTAPFVDDFAVRPEHLPDVLPAVLKIMKEHKIQATIAGHVGEGNFHIIPLMDLSKKEERDKIPAVADKIYDLVLKYKGSITAEHNDGLIRTPYLEKMFGREVVKLFEETKKILDMQNIFNPRKKVGATKDFVFRLIRSEY